MKDEDRPDAVRLIINSSGGNMDDAFALIDVMEASRIPIYTFGLGQICSAALITFMAGTKGHRYITKNTSILSHQFSWGNGGKEHELFATMKEYQLSRDRCLEHYKRHTGQKIDVIKKALLPPSDVWLTPQEAVKYGVADKIIDTL